VEDVGWGFVEEFCYTSNARVMFDRFPGKGGGCFVDEVVNAIGVYVGGNNGIVMDGNRGECVDVFVEDGECFAWFFGCMPEVVEGGEAVREAGGG